MNILQAEPDAEEAAEMNVDESDGEKSEVVRSTSSWHSRQAPKKS